MLFNLLFQGTFYFLDKNPLFS